MYIRLKLHWLLFNVPDEDVRVALAPYGKVTDISKEKWRVQGIQDKGSTTRLVRLKLHSGTKVEELPHQLRVAGEMALLVAPGRPPLCLRCHSKGHIRRECRVPRCSHCRRFGHEESECVKTYASVTGPTGEEDTTELVMDEADAEKAASGVLPKDEGREAAKLTPLSKNKESQKEEGCLRETMSAGADTGRLERQDHVATQSPSGREQEVMDVNGGASGATVSKRGHDALLDTGEVPNAADLEEPPSKAVTFRRAKFKPRPNIPPDRTAAEPQPK